MRTIDFVVKLRHGQPAAPIFCRCLQCDRASEISPRLIDFEQSRDLVIVGTGKRVLRCHDLDIVGGSGLESVAGLDYLFLRESLANHLGGRPLQKILEGASIRALRKLLSILLLAVFGLPFVTPLLAMTAKNESSLPACCRRNGKHHCMKGAAEHTQAASQKPEFRAPLEECPYSPDAVTLSHPDLLTVPPSHAIFAGLLSHPAVFAQMESRWRISRDRSRQKRGPPSQILL